MAVSGEPADRPRDDRRSSGRDNVVALIPGHRYVDAREIVMSFGVPMSRALARSLNRPRTAFLDRQGGFVGRRGDPMANYAQPERG